jgi:hypothetical protein
LDLDFSKAEEATISLNRTVSRSALGTSMPMAAFAGNRGHDPNADGTQGQGQVIGQVDDFIDFDARRRGIFEGGDHRTGCHGHHLALDAEILQSYRETAWKQTPAAWGQASDRTDAAAAWA